MPIPRSLPKDAAAIARELEYRLEQQLLAGNLKSAKLVLNELRQLLSAYDHNARIMRAYLRLYETALDLWNLRLAKKGFEFVRRETRKRTRIHLEATTLLAIAYLRERDIQGAEPLIAEVLRNEEVIKSEARKKEFIKEAISRFDQEGALAALANDYPEHKDEAEVHQEALSLLRQGKSEEEIKEFIGVSTPASVKDFLLRVDQASKNMLTHEKRLQLPSPSQIVKNKELGGIIFKGVKRRLYRRICDEKSDVYQSWVRGGLDAILDKGFVSGAVVASLSDLRIGMGAMAVGVSALLMSQGIMNFCENNKPVSLMELRSNTKVNKERS